VKVEFGLDELQNSTVGEEFDDRGSEKDKIIVVDIARKVPFCLHDLKRLILLFEGIRNPL
jgi:hypothetical protein